ncbi:MAG: QueT transporter family protein [Bacillota bacterium]|nr:QueT transporter family protein [Bacillota bacterium]
MSKNRPRLRSRDNAAASLLNVPSLARAGIIAALYVVLTLAFLPVSFGIVQFRISEALMMLTALVPGAVPGVTIGCFLANILGQQGIVDIIGGTLATAIAALATARLSNHIAAPRLLATLQFGQLGPLGRTSAPGSPNSPSPSSATSPPGASRAARALGLLALPLPTILANGLIVGSYLPLLLLDNPTVPAWLASMGSVALGEALVLYALGLPLTVLLGRLNKPHAGYAR